MKQLAEKFSDDEIKEAMKKLKKDPRNGLIIAQFINPHG
jgi:hypothetical protein